jgi:hypothetical protein
MPDFRYDPVAGRYRAPSGQFVAQETVRAALDVVTAASRARMEGLAGQLRGGTLSLADFQTSAMQEIKAGQVAAAALGKGGFSQMAPADWGWTGQRIRTQYAYLRNMAAQIVSGQQPLNGTLIQRAGLYGEAMRTTQRAMERREAQRSGATQERNRRNASESCDQCISESGRGWVPIGSLSPVGSRRCLSRCKCWIETRAVVEAQAA